MVLIMRVASMILSIYIYKKKLKRVKTVSKAEVQAADKRFVNKVKANKNDNPLLASGIPILFAAKKFAEDTGVVNHTTLINP